MSGRFVESRLGIVPFVKGDRAVGLAVQRVLFNPPHEFSPVCAKEGMLVGGCGVEGTDALRDVRDGQQDSATSCRESVGVACECVPKVASPQVEVGQTSIYLQLGNPAVDLDALEPWLGRRIVGVGLAVGIVGPVSGLDTRTFYAGSKDARRGSRVWLAIGVGFRVLIGGIAGTAERVVNASPIFDGCSENRDLVGRNCVALAGFSSVGWIL